MTHTHTHTHTYTEKDDMYAGEKDYLLRKIGFIKKNVPVSKEILHSGKKYLHLALCLFDVYTMRTHLLFGDGNMTEAERAF